jgi:HD-like signal output (HDOD) protein
MIEKPLANLATWVDYFTRVDVPVLRRTARDLAALRDKEDTVSGRQIAQTVLQDPLLTLKVLALIEKQRRASQNHDITTIERAIMMIGVTPFFAHFETLPTIEDHLARHPQALLGVMKVIVRARRSSKWAREWALLRHDVDVDEVTVAALLHDCAEILCWVFAPTMSLALRDLLRSQPGLRSAVAQDAVFGVTAHDLQNGLARAWRLPALLTQLIDGRERANPRVRNVLCATNLARHSANGWDDPALPDDFVEIAELLHLSVDAVKERIGVPAPEVPTELPEPSAQGS